METLSITGTRSTPEILFDPATGVLSLSGESYPENSFEFFKPVISWLTRYLAVQAGPIAMDIRLSYLNTGSTKCLMDILDLLEEAFLGGRPVAVTWYYDEDNDRALEEASQLGSMSPVMKTFALDYIQTHKK
jgi:hypothetical protein